MNPTLKFGFIWIVVSQVALFLSNILLLSILTNQLTVNEFGVYSLFMSIALFVRQLIYDPFSIVLGKESASNPRNVFASLRVAKLVTDRLGIGLFLLGLLYLIYSGLADEKRVSGLIVVCCLLYVCGIGGQGIYFNVLNSVRERKLASIFSTLDSVVKVLLVGLVFWLANESLISSVLSVALTAFLVFLLVRFFALNQFHSSKFNLEAENTLRKDIIFLSVPFIAPTIVLAIKSVADRWMLAGFLGVNELAGYSTLFQFGYSPVVLFFGMIQTFVAPKIYELCSMSDNGGTSQLKRYLQRMLAMITAGGFIFAIGAVLFGDWVFRILVGKEYFVLAIYLPFFVASGALTAMAGILQIAVIGLFKPKIASVFSVIAISIGIACTAFLIRKSGFEGAVAGLLVSAGLMTLIYWLTLFHMPRRTQSQRNCP